MKKFAIVLFCGFAAAMFSSCQTIDYKDFIGTWGVEKIEYYNIDYAGNPIPGSMKTHVLDPESLDDGIQLIFRADKTGEMRDSNLDTIWDESGESYVVNPDTTLVRRFDYSYDTHETTLYLNMEYIRTYKMQISNFTSDHFIYENEYWKDYVERAYLKRLSNTPSNKSTRKSQKRPHMPGSFLGGR